MHDFFSKNLLNSQLNILLNYLNFYLLICFPCEISGLNGYSNKRKQWSECDIKLIPKMKSWCNAIMNVTSCHLLFFVFLWSEWNNCLRDAINTIQIESQAWWPHLHFTTVLKAYVYNRQYIEIVILVFNCFYLNIDFYNSVVEIGFEFVY